jgi:hypothetical protein
MRLRSGVRRSFDHRIATRTRKPATMVPGDQGANGISDETTKSEDHSQKE